MSDAPTSPEPPDADGPPLPPPGAFPAPPASDEPPPPPWQGPPTISTPPPIAPPPPIGNPPAPPTAPPPPASGTPGAPSAATAGPVPMTPPQPPGGGVPRPPGYPAGAPFPPPGAGYPPPQPLGGPGASGSNNLATAALVVGIASIPALFACGAGMLGGLIAIGLGVAGLSRSKRLQGARGKGAAITGIVTGVIAVLLGAAFIVFLATSDINSDPEDGFCNESRILQDPDC